MKTNDLHNLKLSLESLCVFRDLLSDPVVQSLCTYLDAVEKQNGEVSAYADFVSKLYETQSCHLGEHIKEICVSSENIYVKLLGCGKAVPEYIKQSAESELATLQKAAELTAEQLRSPLDWKGFLPEFPSGGVDMADSFAYRTANIGKFGYGAFAQNRMFYVSEQNHIVPVKNPDAVSLKSLVDYEDERGVIIRNTRALLEGKPAANVLLTGDAGTGKSSTIKAIVNAMYMDGLRIIEIRRNQLRVIPQILDELAQNPLKFILFIDDLSFRKDDENFNALKAVLEGSVSTKSDNVVIYATSNRRHIIKETFSDREGDEVHRNDTMQELISLSDRFGLHVTFQKPNKATYLHIVHHLAEENGVSMSDEELELLAERFALERGGRSARLARQFVNNLVSAAVT